MPRVTLPTPEVMRRIWRAVLRVESFRLTGDVDFRKTAVSMSAHVRPGGASRGDGAIPVRLTGRGATHGFFTWSEIEWDQDTQAWVDKDEPRTDVQLGKAREELGRQAIALTPTPVFIRPSPWLRDAEGAVIYTFLAPQPWMWAAITGSTVLITAHRWKYSFAERIRTSLTTWAAPTAWTPLVGVEHALNSIEANNNGTGVEGHGVNVDGSAYPSGFNVIAASAGNPIVRLWEEVIDGAVYVNFTYANADDGSCT